MEKVLRKATANPGDFDRDFPLAEKSSDFISLIGFGGKIFYANFTLCNSLGLPKKDIYGQPLLKLAGEYFLDKNVLKKFPKQGGQEKIIGIIRTGGGHFIWIDSTLLAYHWKGDDYILCISHDITSQKNLEDELKKAKLEAEALIKHAPAGIYEIDLRVPKFVNVNDTMCKLTGYSKHEFLALHPDKLWAPESLELHLIRAKKVLAGEKLDETVEYTFLKKDGTKIYVVLNVRPLLENGLPYGAFTVCTDVTERKKIEKRLIASEERYKAQALQLQTILNGTPAIIWLTNDRQGRYILGNKAANEFLGVRPSTNVSKSGPENANLNHYEIIKDGNILSANDMPIQRVARTAEPLFDYEMDLLFEDGNIRTLMGNIVPFVDSNDNASGAVGAFIDITERKRYEQQKDEFLSIASHELKTPITSIKAYNQYLIALFSRKNDLDSVNYLNKMNSQINKLIALLSELLDITRIQTGKLQLRLDYYSFNSMVTEVVEQLQLTTIQHRIEMHFDKDVNVYGDRDRVGQVVSNFVSNAIKYSPNADRIIVRTKVSSDEVTLSIQDFGIGIADENKVHIFERFYRAEGGNKETYPGLGLGLYISSEIIKRHQGKVWFDSKVSKGTTFYFSLPCTSSILKKGSVKRRKNK